MNKELKILSVNISKEKGTIKVPVNSVEITATGITEDAHSGDWHRQISILSAESIAEFAQKSNREYMPGEFAENITVSGMKMNQCHPGDTLECGEITLMVTQIGKKCHGGGCAIFRETGACVMPKEGIFAKVIKGGILEKGNTLVYKPKILKIGLITLSTRAFNGVYPDKSGPAIAVAIEKYKVENNRFAQVDYHLLPDNREMLESLIKELTQNGCDIIITTGGTGVGPQDFTPEVVKPLLSFEIPGIMEHIRVKYGQEMPGALLSRGVAGLTGNTLIFTLPGSVNAVNEYMNEILPLLNHILYMRLGLDIH